MNTSLSQQPQDVLSFLDTPRFGILATLRPNGSPQQTVMWWKREGDRVMMNTLSGRAKDRYLTENDRASLCIEDGQTYVTLEGTVEIDRDGVLGQKTIHQLAAHYEGEKSADERLAQDFSDQDRITLYLTPTHIDARGFDE